MSDRERRLVGKGSTEGYLSDDDVEALVHEAMAGIEYSGKRVLVIIPDSTRTAPIPLFFRLLCNTMLGAGPQGSRRRAAAVDFMVALGTHQPMSEEALHALVGIDAASHRQDYPGVKLLNHQWQQPDSLVTLGVIPADDIAELSRGMLLQDVPVTINREVLDYDLLLICGPVFPHEVVGFSGGNKYLFPGVSGPEVINFTHWLGALMTSYEVIGSGYTPVRAVIDRAASMVDLPTACLAMVVGAEGLAGLYIGSAQDAWEAAAGLSSRLHIVYVDRALERVLSIMPKMYDDLWTAAKGMYKMEPAIADGGEVVIYAPHITEISYTHGRIIDQVGYHVRDYFVKQWGQFKQYPWGILAHSTHLRGIGSYDATTGTECPRIRVTLATGISRERCERVNLGYLDPALVDLEEWEGRAAEGILVVPKAGEMLYRVR